MKCEGMQGRLLFSNDIFAAVAFLYLEFFNTKEFKALSGKKWIQIETDFIKRGQHMIVLTTDNPVALKN